MGWVGPSEARQPAERAKKQGVLRGAAGPPKHHVSCLLWMFERWEAIPTFSKTIPTFSKWRKQSGNTNYLSDFDDPTHNIFPFMTNLKTQLFSSASPSPTLAYFEVATSIWEDEPSPLLVKIQVRFSFQLLFLDWYRKDLNVKQVRNTWPLLAKVYPLCLA
jgi:hypothetical protein